MRFSQRYGHRSVQEAILTDSVTPEMRNLLWSILTLLVWDLLNYRLDGSCLLTRVENLEMTLFCKKLWFSFFKLPLDTLSRDWSDVRDKLRAHFFECEWYDLYDFIEFVAQNFPYENRREEFIEQCNSVFQSELSAYRIVGLRITQITTTTEINAIDEAFAYPSDSVHAHLARALELLSDRKNPDYRNSIKESISAVESLVREQLGEKGTLGQLINRLQDRLSLHPALAKAFDSLYGYTSDKSGIRHALMESPAVTFEDAKFLLVACSAFVNFARARASAPRRPPVG